MKIILTVQQLIQVLKKEPARFPITFKMKNIEKTEIKELLELLKIKS